jgi:hypothetical protein
VMRRMEGTSDAWLTLCSWLLAKITTLPDTCTSEIRYSGMKDVYKTKSFRCQNSDARLYATVTSTQGKAREN